MFVSSVVDELLFWVLLAVFNYLLFLPNYLINRADSTFLPFSLGGKIQSVRDLIKPWNPDGFRIAIEITLFIILIRYQVVAGYVVLVVYYLFTWLYGLYHYAFWKIYQVPPSLINDGRLLLNGVVILWAESKGKILLATLGVLAMLAGLGVALHFYLPWVAALPVTNLTHSILGLFALAILVVVKFQEKYLYAKDTYYRITLLLLRVIYNLRLSVGIWKSNRARDFDAVSEFRHVAAKLETQPNFFCLLVESYGAILLHHPELAARYKARYRLMVERLAAAGWYIRSQESTSSNYSNSWLAYTSVLMGMRVTTNYEYEAVLNNPSLYSWDTLLKYFQKQGYTSFNLNAGEELTGLHIPFQKMEMLYGIDRWLLRRDIPYHGDVYGFANCPPDQYVLNYAFDTYLKNHEAPFVLFYLTKNSHTPFVSPLQVVPDWRELIDHQKEDQGEDKFLKEASLEAYWDSIEYQLGYLEDFIINQGRESDVFLLMGDHQPHVVTDQSKFGMETLAHVISRNKAYVDGFAEYGFQVDLEDLQDPPVRHEAFFSMTIREFLRQYGTPGTEYPPYEPEGI